MNKLLTAALATLIAASSALAYSPKDPVVINATSNSNSKLIATKVVTPSNLPRSFSRGIITVEFSVGPNGQPQRVVVVSNVDQGVREQIVRAFRQWKFEPNTANADTRFVLPLEVVVPGA